MRFDQFLEPIDAADPCGPDLDENPDIDEGAYQDYMLPAEDRLPQRFFDKDSGAVFDRSRIDLKAEMAAISTHLARTRDLRLLTLAARFQILSGQIVGFCDAIGAMGGLIERYWEQVHPRAWDGDYGMRQSTLGALDNLITVMLPLQFAPIVNDRRLGNVSQRQYAVAMGRIPPRAGETVADAAAILDALRGVQNRDQVVAVHEALLGARDSLSAIRTRFIDEVGYEAAPHFGGLNEAIGDIVAMIETALPELAGGSAADPAAAAPVTGDAVASAPSAVSPGAVSPAQGQPTAPGLVGSHAEATAALFAAEQYFSRAEPSTPALVLVHQARMLIGKPLVAAIEALMPESAERALIRFDGSMKFQIDIGRMRALTESLASVDVDAPVVEPAPGKFRAGSRSEAAALIAAVETYCRVAEPSSPVPMLLVKARGYLSRDFLAILNELIEKEG